MKIRKHMLVIPMITITMVIGYPILSFSAEKRAPSPPDTNVIEIDECWKIWNRTEQSHESLLKSKIAYRSCLTQLEELRRMLGLETAAENESGRTLYQAEIVEKDAECRSLSRTETRACRLFIKVCDRERRPRIRRRAGGGVVKPKYCRPHVLCIRKYILCESELER